MEIKKIDLGNKVKGEIEGIGGFDYISCVGRKTKIEKIEEYQGLYGYYIKVISEKLAEYTDKNNNKRDVRASKIFGLQMDKDGKLGWTKNSKLGRFLAKHGVSHYKDLIGKEVVVISLTSKTGKEYLSFN